MVKMQRTTGLVMGFGAGTLLSAVAYELLPNSSLDQGGRVAPGFGSGALVYFLGDRVIYVQAFAAGAVLTMLADSMMPEAFAYGGKRVGLLTALGYAVATALTVLQ
jgi:zinc transporter ZupT